MPHCVEQQLQLQQRHEFGGKSGTPHFGFNQHLRVCGIERGANSASIPRSFPQLKHFNCISEKKLVFVGKRKGNCNSQALTCLKNDEIGTENHVFGRKTIFRL